MPEISRFFGIVVYIFWKDHNPPHFHAKYAEHEVLISLDGEVLEGYLPRRALSLVMEWLAVHRRELVEDWDLAQQRKPLKPIAPLE